MSYLQFPRLAFSGFFQADVSTVNNDPRHFDVGTFESSYQEFMKPDNPPPGGNPDQWNGWWNPNGTAIMRFRECAVKTLRDRSGNLIADRRSDPLIGCQVGNSPDRPAGKMVDLDPDWQNASNIYGLAVSLVATDGTPIMTADYESNPFRDLWFARAGGKSGDGAASAMFQSVLVNIKWHTDDFTSRFLDDLRNASERDSLSIRLTTYGFNGNSVNGDGSLNPNFGYGILIGNIGPANPRKQKQPHSFILGRRFMPTTRNKIGDLVNNDGIGCFSSFVDEQAGYLHVDLSNAFPTNDKYYIPDHDGLEYAVLHSESILQDQSIESGDYSKIGDVASQLQALQTNEGGIQSVKLTRHVLDLIKDKPLAIIRRTISQSNVIVSLREALSGLEVRPETFAFKLDPNDSAGNSQEVVLYAARYGSPYPGQELKIWVDPEEQDNSNQTADNPPDTTPRAPDPTINTPRDGINIPESAWTDTDGQARITISGPEYMGAPRGYIDGQLYVISYNFKSAQKPTDNVQQQFDKIPVVVYSSFPGVVSQQYVDIDHPRWEDVQPILQQYANLYPVMSKGLFDFSKKEVADSAAFIMKFVFEKPDDDPDQMPVTRDLSSTKRRMLINYFSNVIKNSGKTLDSQVMFGKRCPLHRFADPEEMQSLTDVALTHGKKR